MDYESDDNLMKASASMRGKSHHLIMAELIMRIDQMEREIRLMKEQLSNVAS
jgi:hypothetical protein